MTVYRVQNEIKKGPYVGDHRCGGWDRAFHDDFCPGARRDGIGSCDEEIRQYAFAFPTLEALFVWFGWELISELTRYGYEITEYQIPDNEVKVSYTRRQCAFPKDYLR